MRLTQLASLDGGKANDGSRLRCEVRAASSGNADLGLSGSKYVRS